jgi:osmotically-inducible protein OsmY
MKVSLATKLLIVLSVVLSLGWPVIASAQSDGGETAGEMMNSAGQSMKHAGSDTAEAARDAYHGTKIAIHDTVITAKVKGALQKDDATEHSDIHVTTSAGIVTLRGNVASKAVMARAEELALNTKGVRQVNNQLTTPQQMTE